MISTAYVISDSSQGLPIDASARWSDGWAGWNGAKEQEDEGMGCVGLPPDQLKIMEETEDPDQLRTIVERIILADRATKEEVPS